jgi:hypothetical protein
MFSCAAITAEIQTTLSPKLEQQHDAKAATDLGDVGEDVAVEAGLDLEQRAQVLVQDALSCTRGSNTTDKTSASLAQRSAAQSRHSRHSLTSCGSATL